MTLALACFDGFNRWGKCLYVNKALTPALITFSSSAICQNLLITLLHDLVLLPGDLFSIA